MMIYISSI